MSAHAGQPRSLPVPRPTHRSASSTASELSEGPSDSGSMTPSSVSSRIPFPDVQPQTPQLQRRQPSIPAGLPNGGSSVASSPTIPASAVPPCVPTEPLPDSLLCRSTFTALEHSAGTLKRLAKSVLTSTTAVMALLEQLETAEDELLSHLGELGRWLEGGYGVTGDVWDSDGGIRKVAKERRVREREELEVMVGHSLEAVRVEIKRHGLAGGPAAVKFEGVSKQYYSQTASYLQGAASTEMSDQAHAARAAQFDLARYNYHSTLLYAVPPSSIACLDLLVGLYAWVGAQISVSNGKQDTQGEDFARVRQAHAAAAAPETPTQRGRQLAASETPVRLLLRDNEGTKGSVEALSRTLSLSLAHIAPVRVELLNGWAERDSITTLLEDRAKLLDALSPEPMSPPPSTSPPELGIRYDKPKKKIGGKIRGLFSSSTAPSSASASTGSLAERAPPVSSSMMPPPLPSRKSLDVLKRGMSIPPVLQDASSRERQGRNSVNMLRDKSPLPNTNLQLPNSKPRADALAETTAKLNGAIVGMDSTADEDEEREIVGRKKEGVLWGTGAWEVLDKNGGKGKWERLYVVLAHSNIYEYREQPGKPETAATVIDLKFASVREGRGTDRRFVFEIVTPSKGRRLYQALSEAEMKTWIYAISNAIESCINGTSTIRSSDRKLSAQEFDDRRTSVPASGKKTAVNRHSGPPGEERRKRRASLKNRFKHGAGIGSSKRDSIELERPGLPVPAVPSPTLPITPNQQLSSHDDDIEKRVNQMAGLRVANPDPPSHLDHEPEVPKFDMAMLKKIADTGVNRECADCGRRHKSSRWATLSLREVPMVLFLCIRCVGVHRGLGTHISKPRSVDLDNWSPEAVLLAHKWGNERGNAVWEKLKPRDVTANDDDMAEYIKAKYVQGVWLSDSDKVVFGITERVEGGGVGGSVGQAL